MFVPNTLSGNTIHKPYFLETHLSCQKICVIERIQPSIFHSLPCMNIALLNLLYMQVHVYTCTIDISCALK